MQVEEIFILGIKRKKNSRRILLLNNNNDELYLHGYKRELQHCKSISTITEKVNQITIL